MEDISKDILEVASEVKKPIISFELMVRLAVYLVVAALAWSSLKSDVRFVSVNVETTNKELRDVKDEMKRTSETWQLEKATMTTQINTCNLQISAISQQLKDMQDAK